MTCCSAEHAEHTVKVVLALNSSELPSLPDFNKRSGLGVAEVEEEVKAFPLTSEEALEPPECGDVGGCTFAVPVCERMV